MKSKYLLTIQSIVFLSLVSLLVNSSLAKAEAPSTETMGNSSSVFNAIATEITSNEPAHSQSKVGPGGKGTSSGDHFHYWTNIGITCPFNVNGIAEHADVEGGRSCSDPELGLDQSDQKIDVERGPFCSCVETPEAYCSAKKEQILKLLNDSLSNFEGTGWDLRGCYTCGAPFCKITKKELQQVDPCTEVLEVRPRAKKY